MNVELISMPRRQAMRRLKDYGDKLKARMDRDYRRTQKVLTTLAAGHPIIDLSRAMLAAPCDAAGRPLIAIMRTFVREVCCWRWGTQARFSPEKFEPGTVVSYQRRSGCEIVAQVQRSVGSVSGYALVPRVPSEVGAVRDLWSHWILWEVERWADGPHGAELDRDPYLLRRLDGNLFAVVDSWEITDIERRVIQAALQP